MKRVTGQGLKTDIHPNSLIEICEQFPEKKLFTFQMEKDSPDFLTGKTLGQKIQILGGVLQQELAPQEKAVLLLPQGLKYIYSMIACLYANVIAIPAPISESSQKEQIEEKINLILKDSQAEYIITDTIFKEFLAAKQIFSSVRVLNVDELNRDKTRKPRTHMPGDIAILLYTSGSTSQPKGVMISHDNLLTRANAAANQWELYSDCCIVSWLPQYHSFALDLNIFAPLLKGASSVILPPGSFVKNPEFWLKMISRYGATHTGAPNFAFDYLCSSIDVDAVKEVSLQSLREVICGGEPVRKETYENFTTKFRSMGLKRDVFSPLYGLSEMGNVTAIKPGQAARFLSLDIPSLELRKIKHTENKTKNKWVASCGEIEETTSILIVHPESCEPCSPEEIGEIWVASPSVGLGYWNRKQESEYTFSGVPKNTKEGGFLRTGDLGFVEDNHLYVVGREKEVIIIHGKNHHPVDIEWTIKKYIPALTFPVAVFSYEVDHQDKVVVVQEIEGSPQEPECKRIIQGIISAVSENHGIEIYEICLVKNGNIPRTGSGKIQRKACRNSYIKKELSLLYQYRQGESGALSAVRGDSNKIDPLILETLKKKVFFPILPIDTNRINDARSFSDMGLDSIQYVRISKQIEDVFKVEFTPVLLFKYRTFEELAEYLSSKPGEPLAQMNPDLKPEDKVSGIPEDSGERDIAIIGVSCHFPGAKDLETYWENLIEQKDCVTPISLSRPRILAENKRIFGGLNDAFPEWGGFIEGVETFDAPFFQISPLEAESMDPQQRKLLELTWSVIEDSGYNPRRLAGENVGVFVGVHYNDYAELVLEQPALMETYGAYLDSGLHMSLIANRISRWFNFHGPSEVINTACSSSLVAVHHAMESIFRGESSLAIAGGINLILTPRVYCACHKGNMLAKDGRCKAFDQSADGFVRSEGYGAVLLKPFSLALKDKDMIYGVIKTAVINHDGQSNSLRAPNLNAQKQLIKTAYQESGLPPETVSYIETHGTGTSLGDPIEIRALQEAFQEINPKLPGSFCGLGTVKTNIGHCESAAGMAGLIKVLLSMKYHTLPGILHFKNLNPNISIQNSPFYIVKETQEWKRLKNSEGNEIPRRAGISSFGFGGVNAHVIVEEYISLNSRLSCHLENEAGMVIIPISARDKDSLLVYIKELIGFFAKYPAVNRENQNDNSGKVGLLEIAYTLQIGREAMEERIVFLAKEIPELIQKLEAFAEGKDPIENCWKGRKRPGKDLVTLLGNDEDSRDLIHKWIMKGKYDHICQYWAQGGKIDWDLLYGQTKPCRTNLPTYPFAKLQYWIPETDARADNRVKGRRFLPGAAYFEMARGAVEVSTGAMAVRDWEETQEPFELMTFEEVWLTQPLSVTSPARLKTMVIFASNPETQQTVIESLPMLQQQSEDDNNQVFFIRQSATFQKKAGRIYDICREAPRTYIEAFSGIREDICAWTPDGEIDTVLYLWPLEEPDCIYDYSGIVYILQAIASTKLKVGRFLLATQFKNGPERCYMESWIGFERSIKFVLPHTQMAVFYQESSGKTSRNSIQEFLPKIWRELQSPIVQSVLFQEEKRHVLKIRPTVLQSRASLLKEGGTYLITGGCGGLGLLFAEYLAKKHPVNLILTGRSPLNEKKQSQIQYLEELGSRVLYLQADVCDQTSMEEGLRHARDCFGAINGVIHAAGIESNQIILEKKIEDFNNVLRPKVEGTIALDEALRDDAPDFICYFSSSAAILGDFGPCDYAVANRFQMAYAIYRNQEPFRGKTVVINWPMWKDGGMSFGEDGKAEMYLKSSGQRFLKAEEGVAIFERFLTQDNTQHLALAGQPGRVHRFLSLTQGRSAWSSPIPNVSGKGRRKEMKGFNLGQCLEWDLKEQISKLLKIPREKLDIETNLADYGFDSINLAGFAALLTGYYGIDITPALFFSYSTIKKLMSYFLTAHQTVISEFYREEVPETAFPEISRILATSKPQSPGRFRLQMKNTEQSVAEPIAIIGMSGRFPEARNVDEMWQNLVMGRDTVKEIPAERFDWRQYYGDPDKDKGKTNCKWCGCIPGVREFDPLFFEISPREAEMMDPRQRLLLEESWKALEDAGYGVTQLKTNRIGMFVGVEEGDYQLLAKDGSITDNHVGILAARLAYFLNLTGPVMAINTACSSGLAATHQAILSLNSRECDTAIAAGANLVLTPASLIGMSQAGMLSGDGKCYAFDKRANGMAPGEAVAVVVLKRLSKAEADGDPIYAVIRGSGINYDGKTNGITAPSGVSQTNLLKSLYDRYQVNPEEIEYIVTHGTGTKLGDPVEINALNDAFKGYTNQQGFCALTSTKTNFGHTMAASGLVGLISLVKALRHGLIPASLHCEKENDYINWLASPFYVNKANQPWPGKDGKNRTGAVSAFGMTGTNVHMVVRSYQREETQVIPEQAPYYPLVFSAKTPESLQEKLEEMIGVLTNPKGEAQNLSRISYTLLEGRHHFCHRCAVVVQDRDDAVYVLKQAGGKEKLPNLFQGKVPRNFTGQKAIEAYARDLINQSRSLKDNKNKYQEILYILADFYCQGYELPWDLLYDIKPCRINLPTYPFAREQYWVSGDNTQIDVHGQSLSPSVIHPLLHQNTSDFSEQRFSSTFTGREFFLKNHLMEGQHVLPEAKDSSGSPTTIGALIYEPVWIEQAISRDNTMPAYLRHLVVLCEFASGDQGDVLPLERLRENIEAQLCGARCLILQSREKGLAERFRAYAAVVFEEIRSLFKEIPGGKALIQIILPIQEEKQLFSGLSGLLKTAHAENTDLIGQLIEVDGRYDTPGQDATGKNFGEIIELLRENAGRRAALNPHHSRIRYQDGKRWVASLNEIVVSRGKLSTPWKDQGIYLITGGAGGLGLIFAREIACKAKGATLILTGRTRLSGEKLAKIGELEASGAKIIYKQIDVVQKKAVSGLIEYIREEFVALHGVIHAAGVIHDNYLLKKTKEELENVLAPKVTGLVNLDEACQDLPLDFFICFSSIAATLGNPGQADYAAANAFMDVYAHYRNALVASKQRQGRTLSINWPLWKEGGMGIDEEIARIIRQQSGIMAMETSTGIEAFYQCFALGKSQVIVAEGELPKIRSVFAGQIVETGTAKLVNAPGKGKRFEMKGLNLEQCVEWDLKEHISIILKIPRDKIDKEDSFVEFGFDSIRLRKFAAALSGHFGFEITPATFFGYFSIEKLTKYLMENKTEAIREFYRDEAPEEAVSQMVSPVTATTKRYRSLKSRLRSGEVHGNIVEPIAIIGMSGRFPGARNIDELWAILAEGRDMVREIPAERFDWRQYYGDPISEPGKTNCKWLGCIPGVSEFDPLFFEISPWEAEIMDPRQRLLLQESWKALEDAGYGATQIKDGQIGMFVGVEEGDYHSLVKNDTITANHVGVLAARLAYFLNFNGPVMAINTACSSGLVAAHQAILSLCNGECDTAIAAAVNLILTPESLITMGQTGILSDDGKCHTFDRQANGIVPGEAVAVVVLKRLSKAEADGDPIYAVIRGSGINYDGKTNGITAPNGVSQTKLLKSVYDQYHVNPEEIEYIVTHGTGTKLGDPVEVNALYDAFKDYTAKQEFCALTSTKTNFGHTMAASGIVGLISLAQALRYGIIPASLHCEQENDYFNRRQSPFYINKASKSWPGKDGKQRTGAVSAFGHSGTNAHMVVQSYLKEKTGISPDQFPYHLLVFSAKTSESLHENIEKMIDVLQNKDWQKQDLPRISYTLLEGRQHFNHRCAIVIRDLEDAAYILKQVKGKEKLPNLFQGKVPRDFTGQKEIARYAQDLLIQSRSIKDNRQKYQEILYALADIYCQGYEISWNQLYGDIKLQRVHLPTYSFSGECYWICEDNTRILSAFEPERSLSKPNSTPGILLFEPVWKEPAGFRDASASEYTKHLVILCELGKVSRTEIENEMKGIRCLSFQSKQKGIEEQFQSHAARTFEEIKNIIQERPSGKVLIQIAVPYGEAEQTFAGLWGLLKTTSLENPKLIGQLIEIDSSDDLQEIIRKLTENAFISTESRSFETRIRYQDGKRMVLGWNELDLKYQETKIPWKDRGIYLLTGGAGGLGLIFTEEISHKIIDATIILTGRSPLSAEKQARLRELERSGARIIYKQVDVTQNKAVDDLIQSIQEEFGGLDGVIHCAGIIRDNFILKKTGEEFQEVLAPKVAGLVNLDRATKDLKLDCFIIFSSTSGSLGNIGQADYSTANAFMDAYAGYRNTLVTLKKRHGRTISMNWPLWQEGGMRVGPENLKIWGYKGLFPMPTDMGIRALYQGFTSGKVRVMALYGELSKVKNLFFETISKVQSPSDNTPVSQADPGLLREKILYQLKMLLSEITKLSIRKIDADEPLESYGIDSLMIIRLNQKLEVIFSRISKTLFYEYRTLKDLADYLLADYPQESLRWTGMENPAQSKLEALSADQYPVGGSQGLTALKTSEDPAPGFRVAAPDDGKQESIAIIGMSGRYPQAGTLKDYWENLQTGKDCIIEIPAERWPLEGFYLPDPEAAVSLGKSYNKWGGFIDGFADFDPLFFNISPSEAMDIDPQERLFIESCWEVLEDAGYTREKLAGKYQRRIGVFAGITKTGFDLYGPDLWRRGERLFPHTSFSSVANRVSYLLNLQGPSMPVDTMCSASLTAIHEACEHLYRGECDMAMAGGVNLHLHPSGYIRLSALQMLSVDGRCRSFGQGSNGFVPGEGVGVVLLKRLSRAIDDEDHIYAVIRGSSINHGGKTNGYTVPNPVAQGELIRRALDKAGVNARSVSYIEAHGTGTELGDPIEITGLTQAFRHDTQDTEYCAIGSVKSNIGHLEAAAGIAGVAKIVLQMQHRKIVPSLHAEVENPNIDFSNTPFLVQKTLGEWKRPIIETDGEIKEYPRIAGISSFGAGGSNAHIIIEEYVPQELERLPMMINARNPAIIPLSAKTGDQLTEQARRLLAEIEEQQFSDGNLADIAYTLQVGREALDERLAIIVETIQELREKLQGYLEGRDDIPCLFRGQVKRDKETMAVFAADEDMAGTIDVWLHKGKHAKILALWVRGMIFDWNKLYGDVKPRRVSLPTYPFAKERYWIPVDANGHSHLQQAYIHPLLHRNTSDLVEQRFTSTFTGREFFLNDHVVKGRRVLPGVAYLEMARTAVEQATGYLEREHNGIRLKNVVWARPIVVGNEPVRIHISLFPEENGEIQYKIYSEPVDSGAEPVIYCQGGATLTEVTETPTQSLKTLQEQCDQSILSSVQCYEAHRLAGIDYGAGYQGIEAVYVGLGQVLAKLTLPSSVSGTEGQFVLHPSMMDSALQASVGLVKDLGDISSKVSPKPFLPFMLEELEIFNNCASTMWALVQYSNNAPSGQYGHTGHGRAKQVGDGIQKINVILYDEQGNVCARMKELSLRILEGEIRTGNLLETSHGEALNGAVMLAPVWDPVPVPVKSSNTCVNDAGQAIVIGSTQEDRSAILQYFRDGRILEILSRDTIDDITLKLEAYESITHIIFIASGNPLQSLADDGLIEAQNQGVLRVFRIIKALLRMGYGDRDLSLTVITIQSQPKDKNDKVNPTHAGIHGLTGSLAKEYTNWRIHQFDLEEGVDWPLADIFSMPTDPQGGLLIYRGRNWYKQKLIPLDHPAVLAPTLYRTGGVYVVIGGAGGIGEVWSEYMITAYQARIIWVGRRPIDSAIRAKLDRLATMGPTPYYVAADAADRNALQQAYVEIKQRYSNIHGIIHSAIVLLDQSLANMDEERFQAALSAKVNVCARMAQVFQKEALDFVLFFSSMQSFSKAPGQSNYAAGCTFKDAFARQLAHEWPCAVKIINWGYWGSRGIVASKAYQKRMDQLGIGSIEPPEAMEALKTLLAGPLDQIGLIKGAKSKEAEGVEPGESMIVYPESIYSDIRNLRIRIPELSLRAELMKPERDLQMKKINEFLCRLLWGQMQSGGWFTEKNTRFGGLKARTGFRDIYDRWFEETMGVLSRNNYLRFDGDSYSVVDTTTVDIDAAWREWDRQKDHWLDDPNFKALVTLAEATLRNLPEILTGKTPATDIIFPNSSMELVEEIYKHNPVADYFNEALAQSLVSYIEERLKKDSSARIRIIEIGAGTGGTSTAVFSKLAPYHGHIQEYCYTDISKAFLIHAAEKYGPDHPYLTYQILNIEKPVAGQGISPGGYDLVIAANVLHATCNIRQTLRNTKAVLKRNGLILLNEITGKSLLNHLTFGLLEGWWLYEDAALRIPGCPGLYPETWQAVLESEGFRSVIFPVREDHGLGQQIIVAESDGVVRQKEQFKPAITPVLKYVQAIVPEREFAGRKSLPPPMQGVGITFELLKEKSTTYIKELMGRILKMPGDRIDSAEPFETYGIDSILVIQLTNSLRKVLDNISSALFFEYRTIDELVDYFLKTQKDTLIKLVSPAERDSEENSGDDRAFSTSSPEDPGLPLKNSRRFLTFQEPEIDKMQSLSSGIPEVAIIGLAGRYPGAKNVDEFWDNLKTGRNCITEIPKERWDWRQYFDGEKGTWGSIYTKWGGFIEDIDKFDPLFFQISPKEAERMDPQERLFLEVSYACIEDAGYTPYTICESRKVGVFAGVMNGDYPSGSNYSSIANRVSYTFNFLGPSIAVDTACSSSLTAIYLALESLYCGVSECAIAGGVNLILNPVHYLKLTSMSMLSSSDQCKSFGDQADGFVDGEGVGAIFLKPLQKAITDGDHIYGIIKGSMVNAGGKTKGYTVPNPNAQSRLIAETLKRAKLNARTISYLEAHGTGTVLGDPIEIAGLTRAFEQDTQEKQFCAIGSAKSNIGHCESAAGIAGVTKVLMQLQHRQLAPSLHAEVLNPNIDFNNTPFLVQQTLAEWKRPFIEGREVPRRAGVSSFGAGGSNAHIIIEEYIPEVFEEPSIITNNRNPVIVPLSAKNEESLRESARRLLVGLKKRQFTDDSLADIAYTLQVGREGFEERLGLIVNSIKELEEKLEAFLENRDGVENLYRGRVTGDKDALAVLTAEEAMQDVIEKWIRLGGYTRLISLWVKGLVVDWHRLYGSRKPRRVSLPPYPFTKERYWITEYDHKPTGIEKPDWVTYIHPLLHQNTSDFSGQRFSSTFTGREFFLKDHVINGKKVLAGATYLEMARAAIEQAAGALPEGRYKIILKDVVWVRPMEVGEEPIRVHIGLYREDCASNRGVTFNEGDSYFEGDRIAFEIYGGNPETSGAEQIYCQGNAIVSTVAEVPKLDIQVLYTECNQNIISAAELYEAFKTMGIEYGPGHQGIEMIYAGSNRILAKLFIPDSISHTKELFGLHPSMLDSAFQSIIGFMTGNGNMAVPQPTLPFALQELEIFGKCSSIQWALVRYTDTGAATGGSNNQHIKKFDLDLCDAEGIVWARIREFVSREPEKTDLVETSETTSTLLLEPVWKEQAVTYLSEEETKGPLYDHYLVFFCEPGGVALDAIETWMSEIGRISRCLRLQSRQKGIDQRFQAYATQIFEEIQNILKEKHMDKTLLQIVVFNHEEPQLFSGLSGLLKTAHLENPKITGQLIEMDYLENPAGIMTKLMENSLCPKDSQIRYQSGKRMVMGWREISPEGISPAITVIPWKEQGIYLITGGAGNLGFIFAKEIACQVKGATLILTGRSPLNDKKQSQIQELMATGARVKYRQIDVTDRKAVTNLMRDIRTDLGGLDGIIHSAGIIRDNYIIKKTSEELWEVLAPKVTGLVNLDVASRELNLDFFILFSSLAAALGNPGQVDYSAANAFMDAYAGYRNHLVALKQRHGQTFTVNWPFWREGGMRIPEAAEKILEQSTGMSPMQTGNGMRAFYRVVASGKTQVMVVEGNSGQLRSHPEFESMEFNRDDIGITNNAPEEENEWLYRSLVEKVAKGKLAREQFIKEIMG